MINVNKTIEKQSKDIAKGFIDSLYYQIKLTDHGLMKTTQIFCMTPYLVLRQMEVQSLMQIFQTEPMK